MFANRQQLEELTERRQPAAQIRWLTNRGYKFAIGASGHPRVMVAEIERHMVGGSRRARELKLKSAA